jgi:isopentenyl-diphosphate delta-isomerase
MLDENERVVLVDERDVEVGSAAKLEAHRTGVLHRAFSVFVVNSAGELLLQRRAPTKYHTGGLWSNTCCGHPRPGEPITAAARRRLAEEMGFQCALRRLYGFVYHAELGGGLREHEYDHVFVGRHDADPAPDPCEVSEWRWAGVSELRADVARAPDRYTPWFRMALPDLLALHRAEPHP